MYKITKRELYELVYSKLYPHYIPKNVPNKEKNRNESSNEYGEQYCGFFTASFEEFTSYVYKAKKLGLKHKTATKELSHVLWCRELFGDETPYLFFV